MRKIPTNTKPNATVSSGRDTFSPNNNMANIIPKSEDVENFITDLIAPTSFSPTINKNREPANPPRLKKSKLGIS